MDNTILRELQLHAHPLASVSDGDRFDDLEPLLGVLKDVRVVGLGENTHGTREFFQMKHRMTRFLVEKLGFKIFTIESGMLHCLDIDEYVRHGKGTAQKALDGQGYWTWNTEEVLDMIEWMRAHNLRCDRGNECGFFGYDIQCNALPVLDALAKKLDKQTVEYIEIATAPYREHKSGMERPPIDAPLRLLGYLITHERAIARHAGRSTYDQTVMAARILCQCMDPASLTNEGRDRYMADNVLDLLDSIAPEDKIVVWAHNFHVSVDPNAKTMGWHLRRSLLDTYYTFGFTFTEGSFMANNYDEGPVRRRKAMTVGLPPEGDWAHDLMQVLDGDFYIDLRNIRQDPVLKSWCDHKKPMRGYGAVYNVKDADKYVDKDYDMCNAYDGIIHIAKTSYARPAGQALEQFNQMNA